MYFLAPASCNLAKLCCLEWQCFWCGLCYMPKIILFLLRYTIVSGVFQFILPMVVISVIYIKIIFFLKQSRMPNHSQQKKQRQTNAILLSISLIFCVSWLPFSVFCVIIELVDIFDSTGKPFLSLSWILLSLGEAGFLSFIFILSPLFLIEVKLIKFSIE